MSKLPEEHIVIGSENVVIGSENSVIGSENTVIGSENIGSKNSVSVKQYFVSSPAILQF